MEDTHKDQLNISEASTMKFKEIEAKTFSGKTQTEDAKNFKVS